MATPEQLPRVTAMRYVQPLREGGSLPAVVDTEDGLYVVKFRGAGQGPKALIAEILVGLLATALDLPVPQLALVDLPPPFGRSEPDPEIQDLLRRSHGLNVGLRYLDGAFNFDPAAAGDVITPDFASRLVWLDALVTGSAQHRTVFYFQAPAMVTDAVDHNHRRGKRNHDKQGRRQRIHRDAHAQPIGKITAKWQPCHRASNDGRVFRKLVDVRYTVKKDVQNDGPA